MRERFINAPTAAVIARVVILRIVLVDLRNRRDMNHNESEVRLDLILSDILIGASLQLSELNCSW